MVNEILHASDTLCVEYFFSQYPAHTRLAVVFSPSMNRALSGNPYGGDLFSRNGYDVIAFKSAVDDWFQGVPESLFDKIRSLAREKGYSRQVGYGSSMGGFAAIAFSRLLELDTVLALSPQYSISEDFDRRWHANDGSISWKYRIDSESVSRSCDFFVVYDHMDQDRLHVERLAAVIPQGRLVARSVPFSGHPTVHYLTQVGLLKELALQVLDRRSLDGIDFRKDRRLAKSYWRTLSSCLLARAKLPAALASIDRAIDMDGGAQPEYHRHRSLVLERLGDADGAIAAARAAVSRDAQNPHAFLRLSQLLAQQGRLDDAIGAARDAVDLSESPYLLAHLSQLLMRAGQWQEALSGFERALASDARVAGWHQQRSVLLDRLQRPDDALAAARTAVALDGRNAHLLQHLSQMLAKAGLLDEAIDVARAAIAAAPAAAPHALGQLCHLLMRRERFDEALPVIEQAIALDDRVAGFHQYKSSVLHQLGRLDEAIEASRRAVSLDARNGHLAHSLSHLLAKKGLLAEAVAASRTAVSLSPDHAHLAGHLSQLLMHSGALDEALQVIDRAIALDGQAAGFHHYKSLVLERLGRPDEAIRCARHALALDAANPHLAYRLKQLLAKAPAGPERTAAAAAP